MHCEPILVDYEPRVVHVHERAQCEGRRGAATSACSRSGELNSHWHRRIRNNRAPGECGCFTPPVGEEESNPHRGERPCSTTAQVWPEECLLARASATLSNQFVNWEMKSSGPVNVRPGMKEVSKYPLRRSTKPLDFGSRGGRSRTWVPSTPMNAFTP